MSPEDRAWLAGILEGLAGREVDPRLIDRIITRCEGARPSFNRLSKEQTAQAAAIPAGPGYGDYDGPGAPPPPEDPVEPAPQFKPAATIEEMRAQADAAKKLVAERAAKKPRSKGGHSTPVAEEPPYTPDNPTVVRMG